MNRRDRRDGKLRYGDVPGNLHMQGSSVYRKIYVLLCFILLLLLVPTRPVLICDGLHGSVIKCCITRPNMICS